MPRAGPDRSQNASRGDIGERASGVVSVKIGEIAAGRHRRAGQRLRITVATTRTRIFRRPLGLPANVPRRKTGQVRGLPRKR